MRAIPLLMASAGLVLLLQTPCMADFPLECAVRQGTVDYTYSCEIRRTGTVEIGCSTSRSANNIPMGEMSENYLCAPAPGHGNDWVCSGQKSGMTINVAGAVDMDDAGLCSAVCSRNACTDWR